MNKILRSFGILLLAVLFLIGMIPNMALQVNAETVSPTAFGIDVSYYQEEIDWERVKPQIDFAILRCGYGENMKSQDDKQWLRNVQACTDLEIPFGVYLYSYALTDAQALSEAQHVLRLVKGFDPALPIYLDLEDPLILKHCSKADILRHTQIFCETIEAAGYRAGVYANYDWWINYLSAPEYDQWDRWLARYASAPGYDEDFSLWQYTSKGRIKGIIGYIDMNYWYGEFPPHRHSYTASVSEAATCTRDGVMLYLCSCGDAYTETIPAEGHDYVGGLCSRCGKQDPAIIMGDLDMDGAVTPADAALMAQYLAELTTLSDIQLLAGDLDHDGVITSADAVRLARFLSGLIEKL